MNHEEKLLRLIGEISELDADAMNEAKKRQDSLAKVPGSLGRLEEISIRVAGITGKVTGNSLKKQCIALFALITESYLRELPLHPSPLPWHRR